MELTIKKEAKQGQEPVFTAILDGKIFDFDHILSRLLTNTTFESGGGILGSGNQEFKRGNAMVSLELENCRPTSEDTAKDVMKRIQKAVKAVNAAFNEKYPAVNESVTYTFLV